MNRLKQPKSAMIIATVAIILILAACGSVAQNAAPPAQPILGSVDTGGDAQGGYARQQLQSQPGTIVDAYAAPSDGEFDSNTTAQDRVILKTANLSIVVDNAETTIASISKLAEDMGGWVVSSSTNQVTTASGQTVAQGTITVRVPAARLDEAMATIKAGGGSVDSESISGQDVTQQYVDLQSHLTNLQAAETQLREIMASATKTEDVLAVYNQLVSTRGDIESVRGQIQYFDESSAFSSITVNVTPKAIEEPIQIAGWSPGRTAERALAALVNLLQGAADLVISVAIIGVPLLIIIGIPAWLIWRRLRRKPQVAIAAPTEG